MNSENPDKKYCNCTEAGCYCDKAQYNEAAEWELKKLVSHLDKCPKCQEYTERNKKLTQLCKKAELTSLKEEERKELKWLLQENLKNK